MTNEQQQQNESNEEVMNAEEKTALNSVTLASAQSIMNAEQLANLKALANSALSDEEKEELKRDDDIAHSEGEQNRADREYRTAFRGIVHHVKRAQKSSDLGRPNRNDYRTRYYTRVNTEPSADGKTVFRIDEIRMVWKETDNRKRWTKTTGSLTGNVGFVELFTDNGKRVFRAVRPDGEGGFKPAGSQWESKNAHARRLVLQAIEYNSQDDLSKDVDNDWYSAAVATAYVAL